MPSFSPMSALALFLFVFRFAKKQTERGELAQETAEFICKPHRMEVEGVELSFYNLEMNRNFWTKASKLPLSYCLTLFERGETNFVAACAWAFNLYHGRLPETEAIYHCVKWNPPHKAFINKVNYRPGKRTTPPSSCSLSLQPFIIPEFLFCRRSGRGRV